MACFSPLEGYQGDSGAIVFDKTKSKTGFKLAVPCRQCIGCRIDYSKEWAIRCTNEAQMHKDNMFLTLTYDDEHLPEDLQLNHQHFQKFIRALRQRYDKRGANGIRYYMCGEYGEQTKRPHYHALIFGFRFPDCKLWQERNGHRVWRSEELEKLWYHGHSEIGSVTFQSAAYCARYIQKKIMGPEAKRGHPIVDAETGEIIDRRRPEYTRMSLRPGIGLSWIQKYKSDVFPEDLVTVEGGKKFKAPLYYRNWLKQHDPEMWEKCREARIEKSHENAENSTAERLAVREKCLQARTQKLIRTL